ncbi:uncharacterized protein LOC135225384 [Macrobrachium nipponense]|uniref:uncharacterized protein LOC135225384 n=1 Tax=Macrobrachium nipponense TaxID=159736 RepID=UPI0030C7B70E
MGIGRGWAGIVFLLLLFSCVSNAPAPNLPRRPHFRHSNVSLSRTPPTSSSTPRPRPQPKNHPFHANRSTTPVAHGAHGTSLTAHHSHSPPPPSSLPHPRSNVQYTLDLLTSPASGEVNLDEDGLKITSHITVEAQLLPWSVDTSVSGRSGCIDVGVAKRAAHLALQKQPPPAGVSLVVVPPPSGNQPKAAIDLIFKLPKNMVLIRKK